MKLRAVVILGLFRFRFPGCCRFNII